jgi:hypothetical protein
MKTPVRGLWRKELGETGDRAATSSSGLASAGHAQVMSSTNLVTDTLVHQKGIAIRWRHRCTRPKDWKVTRMRSERCRQMDRLLRAQQRAKSRGVQHFWPRSYSARDQGFDLSRKHEAWNMTDPDSRVATSTHSRVNMRNGNSSYPLRGK